MNSCLSPVRSYRVKTGIRAHYYVHFIIIIRMLAKNLVVFFLALSLPFVCTFWKFYRSDWNDKSIKTAHTHPPNKRPCSCTREKLYTHRYRHFEWMAEQRAPQWPGMACEIVQKYEKYFFCMCVCECLPGPWINDKWMVFSSNDIADFDYFPDAQP